MSVGFVKDLDIDFPLANFVTFAWAKEKGKTMINSADIDVQNVLRIYGMRNVLESMIRYLGYESDYEINLKVDLRSALENYERRYRVEDDKSYVPRPPLKKTKILVNKVRCKKCNTEIESKHRHDFVWCLCTESPIAVDGGHVYLKRTGNFDQIEELSIEEDDESP